MALGSWEFIRRKFGVGYSISISPMDESATALEAFHKEKQVFIDCILKFIPSAKPNPQITQDILSYILPFSEQEKYTDLFQSLENLAESRPIKVKLLYF